MHKTLLAIAFIVVLFTSCKEKSIDTDLLYGRWEVVHLKVYSEEKTSYDSSWDGLDGMYRYIFLDSLLIFQKRYNQEFAVLSNEFNDMNIKADSISFQKYYPNKFNNQLLTYGDTTTLVVKHLDSTKLIFDYIYKTDQISIYEYELVRIDSIPLLFNIDSFRNRLQEFDSAWIKPYRNH